MTTFVTTLVFNTHLNSVLLVKKNRGPECVIGTWTAIGGKVEEGETPASAAAREVKEEAGVEVFNLHMVATIDRGMDAICHVFAGLAGDDFWRAKALTDEDVDRFHVPLSRSRIIKYSDDLRFLIEMAKERLTNPKAPRYLLTVLT